MGLRDAFARLRRAPSRDKVARLIHRELGRNGVTDVRYDSAGYLLEIGGGARLYLETVYQEIRQDPRSVRPRVRRFARAAITLPEVPRDWDDVRGRLLPVLRPVTLSLGVPGGQPPLTRPALPYLAELAAIDMPDSIAFVTRDRPAEWGVTPDEIFRVARANLRRRGQPAAPPPAHSPTVLRLVDDGDAYWASHLLLDGWLDSFAGHVGGRPVAFVPDRDGVVIAAEDSPALPALFSAVEAEFLAAPRGISPMPYVSNGGRIAPWTPPVGHPMRELVGRSRRLLSAVTYADQAASLADAGFQELSMVRRPDGTYVTVTEWSRDLDGLLPEADLVAFTGWGEDVFVVPWPHVIEHADVARAPGLDPARYQVNGWPSEEAVAALRGLAIER